MHTPNSQTYELERGIMDGIGWRVYAGIGG